MFNVRRRILWVRYVEGGKVMGMIFNSSGYNVEYVCKYVISY